VYEEERDRKQEEERTSQWRRRRGTGDGRRRGLDSVHYSLKLTFKKY